MAIHSGMLATLTGGLGTRAGEPVEGKKSLMTVTGTGDTQYVSGAGARTGIDPCW